ncbi:sugar phosphate isomerase/epimerase|uniref:Sugar phosphate isomerase/epimerase n=1 Tax=Dendrosporobacter quercicolus TaxID=146817 RepID=A0A1G9STP7_9FIRM|nr:sugar phosphate isomerase/epimerase family protein [Dendrosporobacter quercicolus]NSL48619.1 sugar phosphate isomerase/epimerase [Dendrosporobacter quercicolus DSM 1736]SDM38816.1 Sugar phosphate isomerase/epimerase [Dendrosporobacter quercicolus]
MVSKQWKLAVSSADEAPNTAPILLKGDICSNLRTASSLGFDAIEVHTREDADLDYRAIEQTAQACGARVCMVITGRLNTEGRCNLIDDAPYIVSAAMHGMKQYIDMAQKLRADIVVGWVKGNIPPGGKRAKYMDRLAGNLRELANYGAERGVKLNLEVINRYEVNIFTTADETMAFLEHYQIDNCYVHLDTFHMGIDECDPCAAIRRCKGKLGYVHLADNSRRYPGSGQFSFQNIIKCIEEIGYEGYLSVECLPEPDGITAAERAAGFLKSLFKEMT